MRPADEQMEKLILTTSFFNSFVSFLGFSSGLFANKCNSKCNMYI